MRILSPLFSLALLLYCGINTHSQALRNYNRTVRKTEKALLRSVEKQNKKKIQQNATPDLYWIQQYLATMDPNLQRPTPEVLLAVLESLNNREKQLYSAMPGTNVTQWTERGPNNVGGRTRALAWDPTDGTGKKVWAGGISGGLWYNNDITSSSSSWKQVSTLWSNLTVSAIAFDPNAPGTIYVGTGEGYGTTASTIRGFGIWKSIDSGRTFSHLTNTSTYYYVNDIVVRNESGSSVVYAAVDANYSGGQWNGTSSYGMYRSTNGGSTFTNISTNAPNGNKYAFADIELAADNTLYASTKNNSFSGTDKGGGRIMKYASGTWNTLYTAANRGRVEIACAPGSAGLIYAAFESGGKCDTLLVTHNYGANWSAMKKPDDADLGISKWDFTRNQGWYNLIIAVDPNDTNTVVIGGIDLFRSTNGGNSWSQISKWSNNANLHLLNCSYVHADHHEIAFKKGSSSTCIFGTDGGVFYTSSLSSAANSNVISARNKDFNVTQFYWGDISNTSGTNLMIAGSQDNGTQKFTNSGINSTITVTGGDGGACFISPTNNNKQISSYVYNNYYYTTNNWSSYGNLISDGSTGSFINPAEWDDNGSGLFSSRSSGSLYRIKLLTSPGTLETISWTSTGNNTSIDAFKLSNGKTRLFVGTDAGKLYKTDDAWVATPSFSNITGTINSGSIADVYNLRSGDTIAVVLSNYGVNNVYISINGGTSWLAKDGNLPNQPVWSILLNPDKTGEAVIATETGIYGTSNIYASSPVWSAYTEGMGAVKVSTLRYRTTDKTIMAVTHGRGVFTSDAWGRNSPIAYFGVSSRDICSNESVGLLDSSANDPTQWEWLITPWNHDFVSGTDSLSQKPVVRFKKGGTYNVKLTVSNQLGSSAITRNSIIKVTDTTAGEVSISMDRDTLCTGDSLSFSAMTPSALNGFISNYKWVLGTKETNSGSATFKASPLKGEQIKLIVTSSKQCTSPNPASSNILQPVVLDYINPNMSLSAPPGCIGKAIVITANGNNLGASPKFMWFIEGILQIDTSNNLTINNPIHNSKIWVKTYVPGMCVLPANVIHSDTANLVVNPVPVSPVITRNFDTLFASNVGSGNYSWYLNGSFTGTGKFYIATANGTYRCVYRENGCDSDSSNILNFNSLNSGASGFQRPVLWPIPSTGVIYLSERSWINNATIHSLNGGKIMDCISTKSIIQNSGSMLKTVEFDVSALPAGVYIFRYSTGQSSREIQIIRQ